MSNYKKKIEGRQKTPVNRITDINKSIFVDSYILNYSTFFPGKMLGSTLNVGNMTNSEQIVELAIDSNTFQFNKRQVNKKYGNPDLPFALNADKEEKETKGAKTSETIVNSEIKHECWFIENPISKELTKRITLKLGPKAEQDFIIVVRSPNAKKHENLLSSISIGLLTYADEKFGVKESFEDFLKNNYNNSMKEFLKERKKVAQQQKLDILLGGRIEVPNLTCTKEMYVSSLKEKIIPLAIKKGQTGQKYRIPFKNTGPQELELEFTFMKTSTSVYRPSDPNGKPPTSPIEFSPLPSTLKVPANQTGILNVAAKLKNSYQLAALSKPAESKGQRPEKFNHLLIAKVKDTSLMFGFIIEASLVENSGNNAS